MFDPDADMAEHLLAQGKRELSRYPRIAIAVEPQTAKDIDMSGIYRMSQDELDEALRQVAA